ncbi:hypothetical protein TNCV_3939171 [Trichonephila clavipes]|nr:hypothetical protein TNCV_3939171 [Trichonephila clavipes]
MENTLGGGQGHSTSISLPPNSREDLWLDGYLEYPHATNALYIHKHPCHLQDSNLGPTEDSVLLSDTDVPLPCTHLHHLKSDGSLFNHTQRKNNGK